MVVQMAKQLSLQDLTRTSAPLSFLVVPKKWLRTAWFRRRRRVIPRSLLCGMMFFGLGLVSLFTGQIAADLEWSRIRGRWGSKRVAYKAVTDMWKSEFANLYYGCSARSSRFRASARESESNGYLLIASSGGLNQQRTGITDAAVVAWILNATLVVPELDHHSFWKDDSDFANIFDVDWFISYLSKDISVVKRIPDNVMRSMEKPPYAMRPPRKSTPNYYLNQVLPILLHRHVSIALQLHYLVEFCVYTMLTPEVLIILVNICLSGGKSSMLCKCPHLSV